MTNEANSPDDNIQEVEVVTSAVSDDGTVIVDDLKALIDSDGNVLATEETVAVEAPDGTIMIDDVISITDDNGNLVEVEEEIVIIETENDAP